MYRRYINCRGSSVAAEPFEVSTTLEGGEAGFPHTRF